MFWKLRWKEETANNFFSEWQKEKEGFPWDNVLSGSCMIVSAWSFCVRLVIALRRVSLVWVSVPLLQLNLPCHYCSGAACLPAALSLDGRCEAASSVSSQGWLKCGRAWGAEFHDSNKACFICMYMKQGTWRRPLSLSQLPNAMIINNLLHIINILCMRWNKCCVSIWRVSGGLMIPGCFVSCLIKVICQKKTKKQLTCDFKIWLILLV